jgi:anti-sigma factor RsiW
MTHHTQDGSPASGDEDLTCQRVVALLVEYLTGELAPQTALALQEHLRDCEDCEAFCTTYKATVGATHTLRYEDIPVALQSRVRSWLRERIGYPSSVQATERSCGARLLE